MQVCKPPSNEPSFPYWNFPPREGRWHPLLRILEKKGGNSARSFSRGGEVSHAHLLHAFCVVGPCAFRQTTGCVAAAVASDLFRSAQGRQIVSSQKFLWLGSSVTTANELFWLFCSSDWWPCYALSNHCGRHASLVSGGRFEDARDIRDVLTCVNLHRLDRMSMGQTGHLRRHVHGIVAVELCRQIALCIVFSSSDFTSIEATMCWEGASELRCRVQILHHNFGIKF